MAKNKKKVKGSKKGIIIGAVAACAAIGVLTPDKEIESIELSIPAYQTEYDINTEIPIDVSILPNNAKADSVEYIASSDSITFSDSTVNTGSDEGTFEIYVIAGDIESNIVSINVTDISARNEVTAKAEEERLAKETEERKAAEEQVAREAEEKAAAEQAAREAEEKKAAEEQAAKETEEQKILVAQSEKTNLPDTSVSDTATQSEPIQPEETAAFEEPPTPEENTTIPVGEMVWISATGKKYHSINNCGKMNPNKASLVSLEEALSIGCKKCSKCW